MVTKITLLLPYFMLGILFICHSNAAPGIGSSLQTDEIKNAIDTGVNVPKKTLNAAMNVFGELEVFLNQIEDQIVRLETVSEEFEIENVKITKEFLDTYFSTKEDLRLGRKELRKLAEKTIIFVDEMQILVSNWNGKDSFELTVDNMISFLGECKVVLEDSQQLYNKAISNLKKSGLKMKLFTSEIKTALSPDSSKYKTWVKALKERVRGQTAVGTTACILLDIFGTFGLCSLIYNAAAWPATENGIKEAIADYKASLKGLQDSALAILGDIDDMDGAVKGATRFLEEELDIIIKWEQQNNSTAKWASKFLTSPQILETVRKLFIDSTKNLKETAQQFLDRPAEIFESNDLKKKLKKHR